MLKDWYTYVVAGLVLWNLLGGAPAEPLGERFGGLTQVARPRTVPFSAPKARKKPLSWREKGTGCGDAKSILMIDTERIAEMIRAGLPDATVDVRDPLQDRTHFEATVVSPSFEGKSRVQQHKMVYAALGKSFEGPLHALQLTTLTPSDAAKRG